MNNNKALLVLIAILIGPRLHFLPSLARVRCASPNHRSTNSSVPALEASHLWQAVFWSAGKDVSPYNRESRGHELRPHLLYSF